MSGTWRGILIAVALLAACSSTGEAVPADRAVADASLPRMEASADAGSLIGLTFPSDEPPTVVDGLRGGAAIVNTADASDETEWVALNWTESAARVDYLVSQFAERRSTTGVSWTVQTAWTLHYDPTTQHIADDNVCQLPAAIVPTLGGQFVVVTSLDWSRPIAAWVFDGDGPRPFNELGVLECEEFRP